MDKSFELLTVPKAKFAGHQLASAACPLTRYLRTARAQSDCPLCVKSRHYYLARPNNDHLGLKGC